MFSTFSKMENNNTTTKAILTGYGVYIQAWAHPKNFLDFEFDGLYEWPMDTDSMDSQVDPP